MTQAYAWPEGQFHLWTGSHTASGTPIALAVSTRLGLAWSYSNDPSLSGTYRDHLTNQRANITVEAVYTFSQTMQRIALSATAVHMKFTHTSLIGSAGVVLYSGRIDALDLQGQENGRYTYSLQAHANIWSAF